MPDQEKDEVEGPDFVIVDRRASREPEVKEEATQEAEKAAEKPAEEQTQKKPGEPEPAPEAKAEQAEKREESAKSQPEAEAAQVADVYGTIGFVISLFHQQAWHLMGLVPNPITKEYKKDFDQAQVAIDCVAFLLGKLEGKIPKEDMGRLRTLLADLQLNFAKQKSAG